VLEAVETALATAYKKEYGKRGQVVRAKFDINTGATEFFQIKFVVDDTRIYLPEENADAEAIEGEEERDEDDDRVRFDPEKHILIEDARKIKKDVQVDDEMVFALEPKDDFGRIAAQTAKQVIIQKIREAEKVSILGEYEGREGEIVSGTVQRIERGNVYLDLGRAPAIMPYDEQIPGERFRQGERVRAYLYSVEESPRGVFIRVSRSHPKFIEKLFELETPELSNGAAVIKGVAREAGSRSKISVHATDPHIDPVGALVGQRGVRVSTVMSELGGEKIDIIEWSEDPKQYIEDALSPAKVLSVTIDSEAHKALVAVTEDQQSLAIGRAGQNVRLAAKLTGWKIDIQSLYNNSEEEDADDESEEEPVSDTDLPDETTEDVLRDTAVDDVAVSEDMPSEDGEEKERE
jgi:N utilization substance protein A